MFRHLKIKVFSARCIIIAAGNGAFGPNKPPLDGIDEYENKTLFYNIRNKKLFDNKTVAIAGGGDSAADWAIELSQNTKKIYFIHRRTKLRAAPNSVKNSTIWSRKKDRNGNPVSTRFFNRRQWKNKKNKCKKY